tara:strand:- start:572 stop:826 length:255 start_codon:yes stop_codon:yes gene_type:complete
MFSPVRGKIYRGLKNNISKLNKKETPVIFEKKIIDEISQLGKFEIIHGTESTNAKVNRDESGGPRGPEPTRYNDWEQKGRCTDF